MPPRGLPGNANLEQLKKGAKSFQRAVRAGDPGAAGVIDALAALIEAYENWLPDYMSHPQGATS